MESSLPPSDVVVPEVSGADKRQHERIPITFSLTVHDGRRLLGTIADISAGGMRVRLDGDIGENTDVRDWTGYKGVDNREHTLTSLVGEEFSLSIEYMKVKLGTLNARLIRVIRVTNKVFFAMQFTDADKILCEKIMGIVNRRK